MDNKDTRKPPMENGFSSNPCKDVVLPQQPTRDQVTIQLLNSRVVDLENRIEWLEGENEFLKMEWDRMDKRIENILASFINKDFRESS